MHPTYDNRAEIAFIGDSWVAGGVEKQGERLTRPMRERMLKHYADGGIGFIGFANSHIGNGEVSVTLTGTWTQYDEGLGNIAQSKGLDSAMAESSTTGDSIKVQFYEDLDFYEIHTLNTGTWRYNVDGGDWVTVDATTQEVTPITLSLGKHIINIEIVSGTVSFIGSYAYKGTKGVVVHKIGNSGLKGSHVASTDRTNWVKQMKRCRANTFGILLGTNEMAQNESLDTYESSLKEIISRIKEAKPRASVFLIAPSGNKYDGTKAYTIEQYSDRQLAIAEELDLGHVSLYRNLGDFAMTDANGLMYTDGVHPNKYGGYALMNVVYDRLLRM
ncbi:SGNH/GDSL hydrolase family protein [Staphylococcus chromogenes]|nr:SGNH/GDSL hydrolase family protein [Staphylococcus chromogenes]